MRMSSIFKATIVGNPSSLDDDSDEKRRSEDYISGDVGVVLDIFAKKINKTDESLILNLLEGYAFDDLNCVRIKLIRHHHDIENQRTEVQVFPVNDILENWWENIEIMTTDKKKLN